MIRYKRPIRYKQHDHPLGITKPVRYNRYFIISGIRYNRHISIHVKKDFCRDQLLCFIISDFVISDLNCIENFYYQFTDSQLFVTVFPHSPSSHLEITAK